MGQISASILKAFLGGCVALCVGLNASADDAITEIIEANRYPLVYDGEGFSGTGWDFLSSEAHHAHYFLIGEEHGIAENPILAAALFTSTPANDGYQKLVIEVSPFMADMMDDVLETAGWDGLRDMFADHTQRPAFFGMYEEARMLADIRASRSDEGEVLWGVDYEVVGDRPILEALAEFDKPEGAEDALARLQSVSDMSWAKYAESGDPRYILSFSGDGNLVRDVIEAWPEPGKDAALLLETLEETLDINRAFMSGRGWASNHQRAQFLRSNFLRHWRGEKSSPRVMFKLGSSHLIRGRNPTNTYDLGTLLPEIAQIEGVTAFSLLVLPGEGAMTAVLDPTTLTYSPAPGKDSYGEGMELFYNGVQDEGFTVFDMRPLRPLSRQLEGESAEPLADVIHGYDAIVIMTGSTPSRNIGEVVEE